ncbi:MAG: T9SS type A sorting domain-containing protein [Candidatus Marinimicrobia bacterium]|nr:T9SS type A sorting domain-containing protein [Candidatus Neomarinimicrobiota bacterium]
MKKVLFFLLFVLLVSASANPISPNLFSELLFTDDGWQIEIQSISTWLVMWDSTAKFTLVFQSGNDTARYMDMSVFDDNFLVFTPEDLDTTLNLESFEDSLKVILLVNNETYVSDELSWGLDGVVSAPLSGQSICFGRYHHIDVYFPTYYLDNSPTIGLENDTLGANGLGTGLVIDPYGIPITDVSIHTRFYGSETGWPFFEILTDSAGRFEFNTISFKWPITIEKDGYQSQEINIQIWPDSTIELNIVLQPEPEYYQSYFPLQVGNVWKYYGTYGHDSSSVSVTGVTNIKDKQYYIVDGSYVRYDSLGNLLVYRDGKDSVLYYLSLGNQDSVMIPFEDDSLFIFSSRYLETKNTPAGDFSDNLMLYYRHSQICDADGWEYFTRNVGLIENGIDAPVDARGILYYAKVNGVEYPTSGIQPNPGQLEKYALKLANYPNPFNSSTTLKYHITEAGDVRLSVFDLNGRLVEELFSGRQLAGDYHYLWSGGNLPSGVYFLSLQTGNQRIIQKCMLMK